MEKNTYTCPEGIVESVHGRLLAYRYVSFSSDELLAIGTSDSIVGK